MRPTLLSRTGSNSAVRAPALDLPVRTHVQVHQSKTLPGRVLSTHESDLCERSFYVQVCVALLDVVFEFFSIREQRSTPNLLVKTTMTTTRRLSSGKVQLARLQVAVSMQPASSTESSGSQQGR